MITRRRLLEASSSLAALGLFPILPAGLPRIARGARTPRKRVLVVVFLRGGVDGLNLVVPHGDPGYQAARSYLAVTRPGQPDGALDLDGTFGLHPWADALEPHFRSGEAVALHAVGYDGNSRSHFEEQDVWETGIVGNTVHTDGWLNRHLLTSEGHGPIRGVAVGDALPRLLRGEAETLVLRGLADVSLDGAGLSTTAAALRTALARKDDDEGARHLVEAGTGTTLEALTILRKALERTPPTEIEYPEGEFPRRLRELARCIRAGIGIEVATVDFGGWDTHQNQGGIPGPYAQRVRELARGLDAFTRDLGERMEDVLVVTLSEFGRTVAQNGTGGTDHGWGNCLLALGGAVRRAADRHAGPVLGRWPGLAREQLHEGRDLLHTTDFRHVLAELVARHLENPARERVFPGLDPAPVGLI